MKSQDPFGNITGHISSGINTAMNPSRPSTPTSKPSMDSRSTSARGHLFVNAGTVVVESPQRLDQSVIGKKAVQSAETLFTSSDNTFTSNRTRSLLSTHGINHTLSTSHDESTAYPNKLALASASSNKTRVVWLPTVTVGHSLTSGRGKPSTSTWSSSYLIQSLAPASSAISTASSDSAMGSRKNKSASLRSTAAASKTAETSGLVDLPHSVKNRTENMTIPIAELGRRPISYRPVRLAFSRLGIGQDATPGELVPIPPLAATTGSDRMPLANSNITSLETGPALTNDTVWKYENRTQRGDLERPKSYRPSVGLSLSGFNISTFNNTDHHSGEVYRAQNATNCSGLATSTAFVVYETVTFTIQVNETITLGPNATTPLPVLITPSPACQIIIASCEGLYCPSKTPVYGQNPKQPKRPQKPSTTTSTLLVTKKSAALVQQLTPVGNLFGPSTPIAPAIEVQPSSDSHQSDGQKPGPANSEVSTQSDGSNSPESDMDGQSSKKSMPQENPTDNNSPPANADIQNSATGIPSTGSNSDQSTKSDDETASMSESDGAGSDGGATSNTGEASSDVGASGNAQGDNLSDGVESGVGKASKIGGGPEVEAGGSVDSHPIQYVPSVVTAGNLPISIVSNAVIVGSHSVQAGSPPTTIIADGQRIAIQSSQILAQGKAIPIQAAVTPPPANIATIGNVPVVLRPLDVAIGSHTFEHGPSPTSVVYGGQTYSWDASHFVGAGTTIAFPSVESALHVTAGGQVFSVFPSQLKVAGKIIPLPSVATASPFVYQSQTFSVNPSQIIVPGTSITLPPIRKATPFIYIDHSLSVDASHFMARSTTLPLTSGSGIVTYNGQVLTIKPSEIIGPSTTVALPALDDGAATPSAVTTGGLTFSIGPSAAVVGSSTYTFLAGKAPATIVTHGEAVLVGTNGIQFQNIHIPIPTISPSFSIVTHGDMTFSIAPSKVVIDGHTDVIHPDTPPSITTVNGHTISIGPKGLGLGSTTIPLPTPKPSYSLATEGNIVFSVGPSQVVVKDKTYSIASDKAPITTNINGRVMTVGPKGINLQGTTVNLPIIETPTSGTAAGLSFPVGATNAVISGTDYATGNEASLHTVVVGSQTIKIGSAGIMLPSTTVAPEQTPVAVTADGLTFSMDSTRVVINGPSYVVQSAAGATTIFKNSVTMILGTNGASSPSSTIRPLTNAAQTGFSSILGMSGVSSTTNATKILVPIATGRESDKKYAAGVSTRISSSSTLLGLLLGLGTMMLGIRGCTSTVTYTI